MQILQSRAGLIALLQRIPLGELSCAHQSYHVVLVIISIAVMIASFAAQCHATPQSGQLSKSDAVFSCQASLDSLVEVLHPRQT